MFFRQGLVYVAAFDKPAIVGLDTIREAVEDEGFAVLMVKPCEQYRPPFQTPPGVSCDDDYDYIAAVQRVGPSRHIDVPDRVVWIVTVPPPAPPPPELPPPPGPSPPLQQPPPPAQPELTHKRDKRDRRRDLHMVSEAVALAVAAPVMWYAAREVHTPFLKHSLRAGAIGTVLVDGYLLWSYLRS